MTTAVSIFEQFRSEVVHANTVDEVEKIVNDAETQLCLHGTLTFGQLSDIKSLAYHILMGIVKRQFREKKGAVVWKIRLTADVGPLHAGDVIEPLEFGVNKYGKFYTVILEDEEEVLAIPATSCERLDGEDTLAERFLDSLLYYPSMEAISHFSARPGEVIVLRDGSMIRYMNGIWYQAPVFY